MFCPKCGTSNPDEAKFCGKCSAPIQQPGPGPQPQPPPPALPGSKGVSQGMKIGISIGTIVIPLLGLIMGAIYMADANREKKSAGKLWLLIGAGMILLYCLIALSSSGF